MDGYPQLVTDEEFLAVRLRRGEQNTYAPYPSEIIPIRDKAVCALCGEKMARDIKSMAAHAGGVKIQSAAAVYILMTASFWNEWCRSSKCWLILLRVSGFPKPPLPQQMPFASKMNWPSALTGPISTRNI